MTNSHTKKDPVESTESEEESTEEFVLPELDHTKLNIRLTTLKKAYKFLGHFASTANVTESAAAVGITRRTVYMLKKKVQNLLRRGISQKIMPPKILLQLCMIGQSTEMTIKATCY